MAGANPSREAPQKSRSLQITQALTAGEWLQEEVSRRALPVRVLVAPSEKEGVDAFMPRARIIRLSRTSYMKRDPAHWAIAAHELGHALLYSFG